MRERNFAPSTGIGRGNAPDNLSKCRSVLYLRVSTGRQAEQDLSIPDQRLQTWCTSRGWEVVGEYVEAGASATDDKRPEFQRMIDRACDGENSIDAVVVHSFSRFMRDSFAFEFYIRKLAKHSVQLISITQDVDADEPAQLMMRKVIALFDEYQSKENAKHVLRAMKENARQGFWNGARPPFGYSAVEVERRRARIKKKLAIDLAEADTVRLMYRLYLEGHEGSGPMGVKAIAVWLNENGFRTRSGAMWGVGPVHTTLSNPVYSGQMQFNRVEARTRRKKQHAELIVAKVPAILECAVFDAVQAQLKARNPRITPPRVVTGPMILTGLARCATCSGAMTLRTGTSKTGKVHRYYSCSTSARQGKCVCKGRSTPVEKLEQLVTYQLLDRLLAPDRLSDILTALASRRKAKSVAVDERMKGLEANAAESDERLRRLYALVEQGVAEMDDVLKDRITALQADRGACRSALDRARGTNRHPIEIGASMIEAFAVLMSARLTTGEIAFRKSYLGAIIDGFVCL